MRQPALVMEFQFINNNPPALHLSRRLIRSHVMKGKNAGRKIPERGWKKGAGRQKIPEVAGPVATCPSRRVEAFDDIKTSHDAAEALSLIGSLDQWLPKNPFAGSELAYFSFPTRMTDSMRDMIYNCKEASEPHHDYLFTLFVRLTPTFLDQFMPWSRKKSTLLGFAAHLGGGPLNLHGSIP